MGRLSKEITKKGFNKLPVKYTFNIAYTRNFDHTFLYYSHDCLNELEIFLIIFKIM